MKPGIQKIILPQQSCAAALLFSALFVTSCQLSGTTTNPNSVSSSSNLSMSDASLLYVSRGGDTMTGPLNLPANGLVAGSNQLVLSGGNIGIGTATPAGTLDVEGGAAVGSTNGTDINFVAQDGGPSGANGGTVNITGGNAGGSGNNNGGNIILTPGAATGAGTAGNVGIGTASPNNRLSVNGPAEFIGEGGGPVIIHDGSLGASGNPYSVNLDVFTTGGSSSSIIRWGPQYVNSGSLSGYLGYDGGQALVELIAQNAAMTFSTGASEKMRITSSGNVGIGTTNPGAALEIDPASSSTKGLSLKNASGQSANTFEVLDSGGTARVTIAGDGSAATLMANSLAVRESATIGTGSASYAPLLVVGAGGQVASLQEWQNSSGVALTVVDKSGNVGIRTATPGTALQVGNSGDGTVAVANAWNIFSDRRLKKDFSLIEDPIGKVGQLNGYYYYWKKGPDKSKQVGVVAQEVEKVLPEIVKTNSAGIKSVEYSKLSALLIEAVKAVYAKVQEVASVVTRHESRIAALEASTSRAPASIDSEISMLRLENAKLKARADKTDKENAALMTWACSKSPRPSFCE